MRVVAQYAQSLDQKLAAGDKQCWFQRGYASWVNQPCHALMHLGKTNLWMFHDKLPGGECPQFACERIFSNEVTIMLHLEESDSSCKIRKWYSNPPAFQPGQSILPLVKI